MGLKIAMEIKKPTVEVIKQVLEAEYPDWYETYYGEKGFLESVVEEVECAVEIRMYYGHTRWRPIEHTYDPVELMAQLGCFLMSIRNILSEHFDIEPLEGIHTNFLGLRVKTKMTVIDMNEKPETETETPEGGKTLEPETKYIFGALASIKDIRCVVCGRPLAEAPKDGWCADCDATMDERHERLVKEKTKLIKELSKVEDTKRQKIVKLEQDNKEWMDSHRDLQAKYVKAMKKVELLELENKNCMESQKELQEKYDEERRRTKEIYAKYTNAQKQVEKLEQDNKAVEADRQRATQSVIELRAMLHESQSAIEKLEEKCSTQSIAIEKLQEKNRAQNVSIETKTEDQEKSKEALIKFNTMLAEAKEELKERDKIIAKHADQILGLTDACKLNEQMYKEQKEKTREIALQLIRLIAPATHIKCEIKAILQQVEDL